MRCLSTNESSVPVTPESLTKNFQHNSFWTVKVPEERALLHPWLSELSDGDGNDHFERRTMNGCDCFDGPSDHNTHRGGSGLRSGKATFLVEITKG